MARGYGQTLLRVEYGFEADVKTVRRSCERLEEAGFADFRPGQPYGASGRIVSACLDFRLLLTPSPGPAPQQAVDELTLSPATWDALKAYRQGVHDRRAEARRREVPDPRMRGRVAG